MPDEMRTTVNGDRKEIDYTVGTLNATVNAILNELDRSTVEVKFPQPVDFNGNSLDSVSSKAAANTVRQLIRARQLLIAVEPGFTGPLFSVAQYSVIAGNKAGDPRFRRYCQKDRQPNCLPGRFNDGQQIASGFSPA